MKFFQLALQIFQVVQLVAFAAVYVLVAGHVLDLPQVVMFEPVGDYTGPDLFGVLDVRVDFPEPFKKVVQAVFYVLTAVYTGKKLAFKLVFVDFSGFPCWFGLVQFF